MSEHNHPHPPQDQPTDPASDPATPQKPSKPEEPATAAGDTIAPELPAGAKQYSLTRLETQLLQTVFRNQQATFAALLSHIAQSRLAYPVTNNTQLQLSPDATKLTLSELPLVPRQQQPPAGGAVAQAE
jgi:hypothetical protein